LTTRQMAKVLILMPMALSTWDCGKTTSSMVQELRLGQTVLFMMVNTTMERNTGWES
jgi:hypothetical protein